jgi:predicted negative regulator of RcsB-dependent stress response
VLFNKMNDALVADNGPEALRLKDQLTGEYSDTPYAAQAALAIARYDIENSKPDDSMDMLNWAIAHAKDQNLVLLAKLRLARVKLAVGDAQAALATLNVTDAGGFAALYDDVRGDAYVKLGDKDKARAAYQQALAKWTDDMGDKSLIQMKLNELAGGASSNAGAGAKSK